MRSKGFWADKRLWQRTARLFSPKTFVIANPLLGFGYAVWGSLLVSVLICLFRLSKRQPLRYAIGGLGGVILAILAARLLRRKDETRWKKQIVTHFSAFSLPS